MPENSNIPRGIPGDKQSIEKQAVIGVGIGATLGGLLGAANLPASASVSDRARFASQGALRGGGVGGGLMGGAGLGFLAAQAATKGKNARLAQLAALLGGTVGAASGYSLGDQLAKNPGLQLDLEDKVDEKGEARESEKEKAAGWPRAVTKPFSAVPKSLQPSQASRQNRRENLYRQPAQASVPMDEKQLAQYNYSGYSVPRNYKQPAVGPTLAIQAQPTAWDYLKNPLKNLATGGKYTQEQNMSNIYKNHYSGDLQKGPKPAAGNSIRKAIAPMENNPMGGYSTPTQGVLTPYPRKKQGADWDYPGRPSTDILSGTFTNPVKSVPRRPVPEMEINTTVDAAGEPSVEISQSTPGQPSTWDYLKNPLKNLATGGRYAQEQGMSKLYDTRYYPDTLKGPKPAAGNSIRKAIKPMEDNPMGGYSTPTQSVFTPYPRKKQGADSILSGLLGPTEEEKQRQIEQERLDKAVARNMRERLARRIAKEKLGSDKEAAAGIAYLGSVLEKAAQRGLWDNVHAKRKRGEKPAKKGDKDYPDAKSWKKTTKEAIDAVQKARNAASKVHHDNTWKHDMPNVRSQGPVLPGAGVDQLAGLKQLKSEARNLGRKIPPPHAWKSQTVGRLPNLMRSLMGRELRGDPEFIHEDPEFIHEGKKGSDQEALKSLVLEKIAKSPAWQRKAGKNSEGGLNAKGRASYNKSTGGNLKAPVTSKNPKGKAKGRKASFCARMSGMKKKNTSKATASDPDSRINKSLRKWNC